MHFLQILHVINDILTPLSGTSIDLHNPDAFQFLQYADSLDIGGHRVR